MNPEKIKEITTLLGEQNAEVRRAIFQHLRAEFGIHPLERQLNISAETILEAIARSSDLTLRGVRGVIAEAVFKEKVVTPLLRQGWKEKPITGDQAFDFLLADAIGDVSVQVKMQRQKLQRPMTAQEASRRRFADAGEMWVVETQRTRGGTSRSGERTRPYRYGDFDILAVCLHPSTQDWGRFLYTLGARLIADQTNSGLIFKYQPVARAPNQDWTSNLLECVQWLRSGKQEIIACSPR